jgi:beta-lactamase regulating signal transducer with metallopeptidase domain
MQGDFAMSGLAMGWLSQGESMALGWTLLHFCWQGTAVAAAYAFANRLTLRASPVVRYAVATGALALMPLLVLATFAGEVRTATSVHASVKATTEVQPLIGSGIQEPASQPDAISPVSITEASRSWLAGHTEQVLPWVDALWMLGVLLLAIRTMGGWRQLEQLRRRARGIVPAHVEQSFLHICERVNVGRRVILRVSDQVISPMAMGVWRATVILPASALLSLSQEELEAVLAHELGHIRRWDYAWNLLQTALETVLFFHPAVWWLSRKVRDRREVCCDEIAVQSCSDPIVYAQTLLRLEEQKIQVRRLAVAQRGSSGSLLVRVKKVLGEDEPMENGIIGGVRAVVASMVVIGLLIGPKVSDAVAASRPMIDHAVATLKAETEQAPKPQAAKPAAGKTAEPVADGDQSEQTESDATSANVEQQGTASQAQTGSSSKGISYIEGMREAGYALDLDKDFNDLVSMKSVGVTPEFAKKMAAVGLGKPTAHELISLKAVGVTPEYLAEMKANGLAPNDFHEAESEKAVGVTPEYAKQIVSAGLGTPTAHELISLKAVGVTPEYLAEMKANGLAPKDYHEAESEKAVGVTPEFAKQIAGVGLGTPTAHELISLKAVGVTPEYLSAMKASGLAPKDFHEAESEKAVGVTPEFAAEMKKSGFGDMNAHELISLKAQGASPEYATWLKQQFPQITIEEMRRAMVFHLDDKFLAAAKSHGFDGKDLDKLLRLKMSGLLDE